MIHVALTGHDGNPGTEAAPLRTIQRAADLARPGDTVSVHAGVYRERVDPPRGGTSADQPIVFQAAPGERAEIRGSEVVTGWTRDGGDVWTVTLPDAFFGGFNPFREEMGGDWFWGVDRVHHLGDVYIDGRSLFEAVDLEGVRTPVRHPSAADPEASLRTFFAEWYHGATTIWANFGGRDPNHALVEVNVRPGCFLPSRPGIDFITVRGFRMGHAATQWAPPTAAQPGLIGPGWSRGWIIEGNEIHDARCTGISLGTDGRFGDNDWTRLKVKHGTQRQRDVVFKALHAGWSRDTVGSHVVRDNSIHDCEQAGICGNLGAIFSDISDNHIFDIHVQDQYNGAEIAGIKLHAPIDVTIRGNHIHHAARGIWLDWQAQGTRVSGNLLYANGSEDLFVEVSHGPCVVDNNVLLSPLSIRNQAQGTAFAHNLIAGRVELDRVLIRYTPYHLPHATEVAGLMTIQGGDDRWFNNLFPGPVESDLAVARGGPIDVGDVNGPDEGGQRHTEPATGLSVYDAYPIASDEWCTGLFVHEYLEHRFPVAIEDNVYAAGTQPFAREAGATLVPGPGPQVTLERRDGDVWLGLTVDPALVAAAGRSVTADRLGIAFEPEVPFEHPDGSPLDVDTDYFDTPRGARSAAGPFQALEPGRQAIRVWAGTRGPGRRSDTVPVDPGAPTP